MKYRFYKWLTKLRIATYIVIAFRGRNKDLLSSGWFFSLKVAVILVLKQGKTANSNDSVPQILKVRQLNFKSLCKCISKSQLENIILLSFFPRRRLSYNYYYYWYWHIFQQLESIYISVMDWNRVILLTQFIIWWVHIIEHYPQTSVTKPAQLCLAQLWHMKKKKYEINFLWKKMTPKLVLLQSWKKLQVLERKIFWKKILPAYLYR